MPGRVQSPRERIEHLEHMVASHNRTIGHMGEALALLRAAVALDVELFRRGAISAEVLADRLLATLAASESPGTSAATANDALATLVAEKGDRP